MTRRGFVMHFVEERDDLTDSGQRVGGASVKSFFVGIDQDAEHGDKRLPLTLLIGIEKCRQRVLTKRRGPHHFFLVVI